MDCRKSVKDVTHNVLKKNMKGNTVKFIIPNMVVESKIRTLTVYCEFQNF